MAREEIEITISKTGEVTIRTVGIKGAECLEKAELIARLVGQEKSRELTSEYYEQHQEGQSHVDVRNKLY